MEWVEARERETRMQTAEDLKRILRRISGRGYKAYKEVEGVYDCNEYVLYIDNAQADPFASPSRVRVRLPQKVTSFPALTYQNRSREIALRDFLTRRFNEASMRFSRGGRGTGLSGSILIDSPRQEILERTSVLITDDWLEARFVVGLPAQGRSIDGHQAELMLFEEVPKIVRNSLIYRNLDAHRLAEHIETAEDAGFMRQQLSNLGLVAFVADGAILPRASGIDSRPLSHGHVIPFESPETLRVTVQLPNRGAVTGMGIPAGITLIVGGGYHGKSTLLRALELGVYNHVPRDGRELVVTSPNAIKIRAEDGRRIEKVDISPFISNLPFGQNTSAFSSDDASGSTSQAANIIEALEVGGDVLLIDEDTSATNFMIRDHRMQELVAKDKEPITPFIDKVRQLYCDHGISTILVIGGSGDYFDVADNVICMIDYKPRDWTQRARQIAEKYQSERLSEGGKGFGRISDRLPLGRSLDASKGRRDVKISAKGLHSIAFGTHIIDLGGVEQLVHVSQTRAIGDAMHLAASYMDGSKSLKEIISTIGKELDQKGLGILNTSPVGDYAAFRGLELAAAVNRLRTLSVLKEGL